MRTCTKCGQEKPLTEYWKDGDGYQSWCIPCFKLARQPYPQRVRITAKTAEEFYSQIVVEEGDHWRHPLNTRASAIFGEDLLRAPATWCDGDLPFKCLNPEHQTSVGSLPIVTLEEVYPFGSDGPFNVLGHDDNPDLRTESQAKQLRRLDDTRQRDFSTADKAADEFLREHGFNTRGEPAKNPRKRNKN